MNEQTQGRSAEVPLDQLIQRCVDGELTNAAETELLQRLDFDAAGWKRLALGMIENRLLTSVAREATLSNEAQFPYPQQSHTSIDHLRVLARLLPLAAALLLAFGLGRWTTSADGTPLADATATQSQIAHQPRPLSKPVSEQDVIEQAASDTTPLTAKDHSPSIQPAMFVNLAIPGNDEPLEVPIYSTSADSAVWQPFAEPSLTTAQAEALRRAGYHVESRHELMRFRSPDGREVVVPLESVGLQMARY